MKPQLRFMTFLMLCLAMVLGSCGMEDKDNNNSLLLLLPGVNLAIGDNYEGGIIAYIFQPGDPGYVDGETHGLIAAVEDQSTGIIWALPAFDSIAVPGGTEVAIGTGLANTDKIITQNGAGSTYAAGLARAYNGGGYTDWYLPSHNELKKLYLNRVAIGGFTANWYWDSSENNSGNAWSQKFDSGMEDSGAKNDFSRVRAVRTF